MPERIQLSRRKGWRKPEGAVSVARPGRWGNPFPVDTYGLELSLALFRGLSHGMWNPFLLARLSDEEYAVAYRQQEAWKKRLGGHPAELARAELSGLDLACWCALDQPCHADLLLELAN